MEAKKKKKRSDSAVDLDEAVDVADEKSSQSDKKVDEPKAEAEDDKPDHAPQMNGTAQIESNATHRDYDSRDLNMGGPDAPAQGGKPGEVKAEGQTA